MLRIIIVFFLLFFPTLFFLYNNSKDNVIDELITASQNNDVAAMEDRIDFEALRDYLKEDLVRKKQGLGQYGGFIGPDTSDIPDIVDYYVQPENLELAFYYHENLFPNIPEENFIHEVRYAPPFGFSIVLGYPETAQATRPIDPVLRDRMKIKFTFRLEGLTWKAKEMDVPIFMVPRRSYPIPAIERFNP